jgi:hypothetical protein
MRERRAAKHDASRWFHPILCWHRTRSTLDSLTGIVFDDDARVAQLELRKVYAAPGQEGARIEVSELRRGVVDEATAARRQAP